MCGPAGCIRVTGAHVRDDRQGLPAPDQLLPRQHHHHCRLAVWVVVSCHSRQPSLMTVNSILQYIKDHHIYHSGSMWWNIQDRNIPCKVPGWLCSCVTEDVRYSLVITQQSTLWLPVKLRRLEERRGSGGWWDCWVVEWSRCWCCLVLLAPSSLLPPARAISHHFYSNLALQQQLFLLGSRSAAGGNNKMKITANLLYRGPRGGYREKCVVCLVCVLGAVQ